MDHSFAATSADDLVQVLRRYGFLGLGSNLSASTSLMNAGVWHAQSAIPLEDALDWAHMIVAPPMEEMRRRGLPCQAEPAGGMLQVCRAGWFWSRKQHVYRCLFPHVSFSSDSIEPVWTTQQGRTVLGWWHHRGRRILLVGLDVASEVIRYNQGNPAQVERVKDKTRFSFSFERANYLFDEHIVPGMESIAWADRLGYTLVQALARATGWPLVAPMPDGVRGMVLLTGDDDQAALDLYREQLEQVGSFPITYYLLPMTHHTEKTLKALPPSVELGLHVDALEQPQDYDAICTAQAQAVRALTSLPVRSIRNHGFLNRGYLGHLNAWERDGLPLDVNYAGLNGTALTGSYLPFRVRRADGKWTDHFSLLTAFGDGMLFICKWSQQKAGRRIDQIARQIEAENPGVLVFNMHPGNIKLTPRLHRAILALGRRPGWLALGADTYLEWLKAWHQLQLHVDRDTCRLEAPVPINRVAILWPGQQGWHVENLGTIRGTKEVWRPRLAA